MKFTLEQINQAIGAVNKKENRNVSLATRAFHNPKSNRLHLEGSNISDFERVRRHVAMKLNVSDVYVYNSYCDDEYIEV